MDTVPPRPPRPLTAVVNPRWAAAEAAAACALALLQSPALWDAMRTVHLALEVVSVAGTDGRPANPQLAAVIDDAALSVGDADQAMCLLEAADHAARAWSRLAYAHAA